MGYRNKMMTADTLETLSCNLKKYTAGKNITELCIVCDVSRTHFYKVIRLEAAFSIEALIRISDYLGITVNDLIYKGGE